MSIVTSKNVSYINLKENYIPNKTKNYITLIDNLQIYNINPIIYNYPFLLEKYFRQINVKNFYLIITYPEIKTYKIESELELYTVFRKIIHNKINLDTIEIFDKCIKYLDNTINNEIVIFTDTIFEKDKEKIQIITDNKNNSISIICNYTNINSVELNAEIFITTDYNNSIDMAYIYLITNGIFLKEPPFINLMTIKLNNNYLYGTQENNFTINNMEYDSFMINGNIEELSINGKKIKLKRYKSEDKNICLNAINHILHYSKEKSITSLIFIKNKLFEYINLKKNNNIKNKSILLYKKVKLIINELIIGKIDNLLKTNNEDQIIFEYTKKVMETSNNYLVINQRIFHNIKSKILLSSKNNDIENFIKFNNNNNKFNDSCEFFNSEMTLSNWFDEIKNNGGLGLLINITTNNIGKIGYYYNNISINNITTTFFPIIDYISVTYDFFDKNQIYDFGNLNNINIITDAIIGNSNSLIPIYINKYHWNITKNYIDILLGIIISHNPFNYAFNYKSLFFTILNNMTYMLFTDITKKNVNEKFIKIYFAYLRTCTEICFELKYNYGIKKLINLYLQNPLNRISKNNCIYDNICAQSLATGYILNDNDIKSLILYFIEEIIRISVKDKTKSYFENYNNSIEKETELNIILDDIFNIISYDINVLVSYYKMNKLMDNIIQQYKSFSRFIRMLDINYGLIDNIVCINIIKNINIYTIISFEQLFDILNINYNKYSIMLFIIQGIIHKKNNARKISILNNKYIDCQKQEINQNIINSIMKKIII